MTPRWNILYRGPLSSCNYACSYCPFAKTTNTYRELAEDTAKLNQFADWVSKQRDREIGILFTPWGEALTHKSYQQAIVKLSQMPNVYKVAIQTNLSCPLKWIHQCDPAKVALWATYHPTQTTREKFLAQCQTLDQAGYRYSVGTVGFKDAFEDIALLREELAPSVYLWINANKRDADYYSESDILELERIDPHFKTNTIRHPSLGKKCRAGHSAFSVDGNGDTKRCHFIPTSIGNIYQDDFREGLPERPAPCSNDTCSCHIGYVHMESMQLDQIYGDSILERIPLTQRKFKNPVTAGY